MNPLEKKRLGSTDLWVTRIGLGCAPLGGLYGDIPDDQAIAVVKRALSLGMNLIDTAPLYGSGKSETRVGWALQGVPRESYVLATKVGRVLEPTTGNDRGQDVYDNPYPFRPVFDYSYDGVMRSFEESLKRLQISRIDILHIHDPDDHYEEAMRGAYPALCRLREQKLIHAVSAGMNQWQMLARFAREGVFDCFMLAGRYSLLEQDALDEFFPLCLEKKIGILLGGTYNSGILAGNDAGGAKYNYADAPPEIMAKAASLKRIAAEYHVDLKAAASQFALAHPAVTAIVPGTRKPQRVEENYQLLLEPIPATFWNALKSERLLHPDAPTPPGNERT